MEFCSQYTINQLNYPSLLQICVELDLSHWLFDIIVDQKGFLDCPKRDHTMI